MSLVNVGKNLVPLNLTKDIVTKIDNKQMSTTSRWDHAPANLSPLHTNTVINRTFPNPDTKLTENSLFYDTTANHLKKLVNFTGIRKRRHKNSKKSASERRHHFRHSNKNLADTSCQYVENCEYLRRVFL